MLSEAEGKTNKQLENIICQMRRDFDGDTYHVMMKNCNAFSNALLMKIFNRGIPGYINRSAYIGSLFSFCLPPSLIGTQGQQQIVSSNSAYVPFAGPGNKINDDNPEIFRISNGNSGLDDKSKESLRDLRLRALQGNPSA